MFAPSYFRARHIFTHMQPCGKYAKNMYCAKNYTFTVSSSLGIKSAHHELVLSWDVGLFSGVSLLHCQVPVIKQEELGVTIARNTKFLAILGKTSSFIGRVCTVIGQFHTCDPHNF